MDDESGKARYRKLMEMVERMQGLDRVHHLHPFTDPAALKAAPPFVIDSGVDCFISGQGIRLLDMMAGLANVILGYGREELAETAKEAMTQLSYYQSFAATTNPYAASLAARVAARAPGPLNRVFFANSGSEANETLLKLALLYWRAKGQPEKRIIISRDLAYHGSTIATTALNGVEQMIKPFGIEGDEVRFADSPFWYRYGGDMSPEEFGLKAAASVEQRILEEGPEEVAAFIGEPIQGTTGVIVPPDSYWPEVARICRKYNVLLIADEVITGFGRTGHWFAQETFGFQADMMTLAKGMASGAAPISAAVVTDEIVETITNYHQGFSHGFTTSAHPVSCALALTTMDILERDQLVERVRDQIGPYFHAKLVQLESHPLVGEVRCKGLMAAIELVRDKDTRTQYPLEMAVCNQVSQTALTRGVIVRPTGNTIVLCPPFILKEAEADYCVQALSEALDQVYRKLGPQSGGHPARARLGTL
ncbi:aminotransferase [Yunchengibacter salinarum]|uniref:aminotransferase n=1 Tax=Yunchengibacter salinarum TaxID=3133399 RepID=UPI0035B5D494